jgi:DNA-binding GntR family transcriptional regulator
MSVQTAEPCTVYVFHRSPLEALEVRIRGEYREMPGMRLKPEQAMRLWALDRSTCQQALDDLVREGFLQRDGTGRYARAHSGY